MRSHGKASIAICVALALALVPSTASADVFLANNPAFFTAAGTLVPNGLAINATSEELYAAQPTNGSFSFGKVNRYSSTGTLLASTFPSNIPQGVAVNPTNGNVYAFNPDVFGGGAAAKIEPFDSTGGSPGTPIAVSNGAPKPVQIATDAAGNVYYPNTVADVVQKFSPAGALLGSFPAVGTVPDPTSVAIDSDGEVYVLDTTAGGRVQKFDSTGANPTTLATANPSGTIESVAVNPSNDEVFVFRADGTNRHIGVYDDAGAQWFDFGSGTFGAAFDPFAAHHIAVNPNTGMVYVSGADSTSRIYMFKRIVAPIVSTEGSEAITQTTATVEGKVNPNGAPTSCQFEYGTSTAYEHLEQCSFVPGHGTTTLEVDAKLIELEPGTTYHYRARALNAGGVINGQDATFTTQPAPPAEEGKAPSTPAPPVSSTPPASTPPATTPPKRKTRKCPKGTRKVKVRGKTRCKRVKRNNKRTQSTNRGGVK